MNDPETSEDFETLETSRRSEARAALSFLWALGVLVIGAGIAFYFVKTKKSPEQEASADITRAVRVSAIEPRDHQVEIITHGVVESRRVVDLAAEVSGRVRKISPQLIAGGTVTQGDVLVELDATDFLAARERAASELADAELALAEERARAEQAKSDWEKLGRGEPSDLALRKPQLASTEARVAAARAELARAEQDLARSKIRAPFDARVRTAAVEVGAVVMPGTMVATLFSPSDLEVQLPFSLREYGLLDRDNPAPITLHATLGDTRVTWPARFDRLTGEVERTSLSAYGIARIEANAEDRFPPVGLFVEATVPGRTLRDVTEIPRSVVRGENTVWVERDGKLARCRIDVQLPRRETLIVRGDFAAGDRLVLTRLSTPLEGMQVEVKESESESTQPAK